MQGGPSIHFQPHHRPGILRVATGSSDLSTVRGCPRGGRAMDGVFQCNAPAESGSSRRRVLYRGRSAWSTRPRPIRFPMRSMPTSLARPSLLGQRPVAAHAAASAAVVCRRRADRAGRRPSMVDPATRRARTRSSPRTACRATPDWDIDGRGRCRPSRASRPRSASTAASRSPSRSRRSPLTIAWTSTAWGTTAATGARKVATIQPSASLPQMQPALPRPNASHRPGRLRQLGACRPRGRCRPPPRRASTSRNWCARISRRRAGGGQPHPLHRPRRHRPVGSAVPDLRHDVAGLQHVRRQQPLRRRHPLPGAPTR